MSRSLALVFQTIAITHGLTVLTHAGTSAHRMIPRRHAGCTLLENPLANFFGNDKKKKKEDALTTGLDTLLKDAPLPVKIMGSLIKPLVGQLGSMIAEGQADGDELLAEAQSALRGDPRVASIMGEGIEVGAVFSTASSSSNVNGIVNKDIRLQAQCTGARGSGVVAIRGVSDGAGGVQVISLQLQAGGQVIEVPTLRGGGGNGGMSSAGSSGGGDVIDVEVM